VPETGESKNQNQLTELDIRQFTHVWRRHPSATRRSIVIQSISLDGFWALVHRRGMHAYKWTTMYSRTIYQVAKPQIESFPSDPE
jgi:hypothetical protein